MAAIDHFTNSEATTPEGVREIAQYLGDALGITVAQADAAIGFSRNGSIVGAAVLSHYNGSNVNLTIYAPRWTKGVARALAYSAFIKRNCNRVSVRTSRANRVACRQLPKIGFVFEGVSPRFFGPQRAHDAILYRIDRETAIAKWMKEA